MHVCVCVCVCVRKREREREPSKLRSLFERIDAKRERYRNRKRAC